MYLIYLQNVIKQSYQKYNHWYTQPYRSFEFPTVQTTISTTVIIIFGPFPVHSSQRDYLIGIEVPVDRLDGHIVVGQLFLFESINIQVCEQNVTIEIVDHSTELVFAHPNESDSGRLGLETEPKCISIYIK